MKFAMLGSPGAGQTSFIASLYHQIGRNSFKGFKLHGTRRADLELSLIWKNIVTQSQWPEHDNQTNRYTFDLLYDDQKVESIDIYSYPSTIIQEAVSTNDVSLFETIDGLILFFDANILIQPQTQIDTKLISEVLENFIETKARSGAYVTIVLTKCDLINKMQLDDFNNDLSKALKNILDILSRSVEIKSIIVMTSSLGKKPTYLPAAVSNSRPTNTCLCFNLDAYNVTYPILNALEWVFYRELQKDEQVLSINIDEMTKLIKSYSIKEEFVNLMFNRARKYDQIIKKIDLLIEHKTSLNKKKQMLLAFQQETDTSE